MSQGMYNPGANTELYNMEGWLKKWSQAWRILKAFMRVSFSLPTHAVNLYIFPIFAWVLKTEDIWMKSWMLVFCFWLVLNFSESYLKDAIFN